MEEEWGGAGLTNRVMRLQYRFFDKVRDRRALAVARQPGTAPDFSALRRGRHCLLVTFKRSGEPVPTPVWFGLADDKVYFRSEAEVAKVKRLRNDPHVRVGPCNARGTPRGPMAEGTARLLPPEENERAEAAIQANFGVGRRVYERTGDRLGLPVVYVEPAPAGRAV